MSVNATDKDARAMRSYAPDLTQLPPEFEKLLVEYSKIPPSEAVAYVNATRKRAFDICPYPSIGQFKFILLDLLKHPEYSTLLKRLKSGQTFLDVGCCFAQDMRQLVASGVPSDQLYGLEIEQGLIDAAYDLFRDRDTLKAKFLIGDAVASPEIFADLHGKIDVINDSAFSHLFPWETQVKVCALMARFSRPGALIIGRMTGSLKPAEYPALKPGSTGWRHDVASLQRLWDEVGEKTGTKWKAHGTMDLGGIFPVPDGKPKDPKDLPVWWEPNVRRLLFHIERL